MADLHVVIVTYNNEHDIGPCLDAVGDIDSFDVTTVVVDNASSDDTVSVARAHPATDHVVANDDNLGFGVAVNQGAQISAAGDVLLLNPDAVLRPGAVQRLMELRAQRGDQNAYAGLTELSDGRLDPFAFRRPPTLRSLLVFATAIGAISERVPDFERLPLPDDDDVQPIPMMTASLLLLPRQLWNRLGGFDERYFLYSEDTDLCSRIAKLGGRIYLDPQARVLHDGGASAPDSGRRAALMLAGRATYVRLQWSAPRRVMGIALLQCGVGVRALLARLRPGAERWRYAWHVRRWWRAGYRDDAPTFPPDID